MKIKHFEEAFNVISSTKYLQLQAWTPWTLFCALPFGYDRLMEEVEQKGTLKKKQAEIE